MKMVGEVSEQEGIKRKEYERKVREVYEALDPYNHKLVVVHMENSGRIGKPGPLEKRGWWDNGTLDWCVRTALKGLIQAEVAVIDEIGEWENSYPLNGSDTRIDRITDLLDGKVIYENPDKKFGEGVCRGSRITLGLPRYSWLKDALEKATDPNKD